MKIVAIIQARMGSTRLPDKVLLPVLGKPLLGWMLGRVAKCSEIDDIIVATTTDPRDNNIVHFAQSIGCKTYRGSEDDVLDRYYQAASLVSADVIIRITADCPLLDPQVLDQMIRYFTSEELDFLSNSEPLPSSWPDGMDVSIVNFDSLQLAWKQAVKPSEREHVTFYFWNNPSLFKCKRIEHEPNWSKYRVTIDYQEDFDLIKAIIEHFDNSGHAGINDVLMKDIVNFLNENPALYNLNEKYTRGMGWKPALERDKKISFN